MSWLKSCLRVWGQGLLEDAFEYVHVHVIVLKMVNQIAKNSGPTGIQNQLRVRRDTCSNFSQDRENFGIVH